MARFIKTRLYNTSVDSGTTSAGTDNKLTEAGQNFLATVSAGDIVVAAGVVYTVSAVDSNTVLSVDGGGVPTLTAYTIYAGDAYTDRMFSAENIMYTSRTDAYNTVIKYNHAQAAMDTLTLTHKSDANSEYVVDSINNLLSEIHSGKRAGEVLSTLNTDVILVTGPLS
jgi:hypothetical protein